MRDPRLTPFAGKVGAGEKRNSGFSNYSKVGEYLFCRQAHRRRLLKRFGRGGGGEIRRGPSIARRPSRIHHWGARANKNNRRVREQGGGGGNYFSSDKFVNIERMHAALVGTKGDYDKGTD